MKNKTSTGLFWVVAAVLSVATSTLMATPPPPSVPDAGSSALLLGSVFAGVAAYRRYFGKK